MTAFSAFVFIVFFVPLFVERVNHEREGAFRRDATRTEFGKVVAVRRVGEFTIELQSGRSVITQRKIAALSAVSVANALTNATI